MPYIEEKKEGLAASKITKMKLVSCRQQKKRIVCDGGAKVTYV